MPKQELRFPFGTRHTKQTLNSYKTMETKTRSTRTYVTDRAKSTPPTLVLTNARLGGTPASSQLVSFSWSGLSAATRWRR